MWIGAPSIPVVLLQASASLIASPQRLPLIARVCVSPERVLGRSSDSQVETGGGRRARVDAIGPGDPGGRVAQRGVLVGRGRGPRELRAHRGGAAAGELFRQNRTQQWRRSHRGRSGRGAHRRRAARVAHVWPAYGCGSYATSRQSGQDHQEPLCELIPYISEFDRATELKKSERSGKLCKPIGCGYSTRPRKLGRAKSSNIKGHPQPAP